MRSKISFFYRRAILKKVSARIPVDLIGFELYEIMLLRLLYNLLSRTMTDILGKLSGAMRWSSACCFSLRHLLA